MSIIIKTAKEAKMILEYKIDEMNVQSAWLKTLYDLVDELNCKCQTFFEEKYNPDMKCFAPTRTVKISGSTSMLGWLKLRMERYTHFVESLNTHSTNYEIEFCEED